MDNNETDNEYLVGDYVHVRLTIQKLNRLVYVVAFLTLPFMSLIALWVFNDSSIKPYATLSIIYGALFIVWFIWIYHLNDSLMLFFDHDITVECRIVGVFNYDITVNYKGKNYSVAKTDISK